VSTVEPTAGPAGPSAAFDVDPRARAALILNPRARRGRRAVAAIVAALLDRGVDLRRVVHARTFRRTGLAVDRLLAEGVRRVIVGGGDGTVGSVAARLAGVNDAVLGVIPLGTANDFARTLGIPKALDRAVEVAAGRHARAIDLARANDAYFLNVASVGMSVAATRQLSARLKRWLGPGAYVLAGLRAFLDHATFRARIETPGESTETLAHQIVVGNGRFYGGGVLVARSSTLDDGLLAAYALGAGGRWRLLHTVALLRLQIPLDRPGDFFVRAPTLTVATVPRLGVNLDGEVRTSTPVVFRVVPAALRVLVPAE